MMKIEELIAGVKNSVEAKKVYAEPYERNWALAHQGSIQRGLPAHPTCP
jgi:hypothetical protein